MKYAQRLDYARLAEVLHERGLVDPAPLGEILQASIAGGSPFAEAVIQANLISDWDLACVVADIFNLPIVTPDVCVPDREAADAIGVDFLIQHGLVPMGRFGQVLSIAMPCLVPADVLGILAAQSDMVVQPIVSTVTSNRRWIEDNLSVQEVQQSGLGGSLDGSWQNIFDDADAAVQMEATETPDDVEVGELDIDAELAELEAEGLEMPALEMSEGDLSPDATQAPSDGPVELPPLPDFNLGDEPAA